MFKWSRDSNMKKYFKNIETKSYEKAIIFNKLDPRIIINILNLIEDGIIDTHKEEIIY